MEEFEEEYVTYPQALALKELGFDKRCFGYFILNDYYEETQGDFETVDIVNGYVGYSNYESLKSTPHRMLAPLKQQVFKWFREKYGMYQDIVFRKSILHMYEIVDINAIIDYNDIIYENGFVTYEEAEKACINKLIELAQHLKNQDQGKYDNIQAGN